MKHRPITVIVLSALLIGAGAIGFFYHLSDFKAPGVFRYENIWIELLRLTAIVCGVFMLGGSNWARWLAVAWLAFHVAVSAFHNAAQFAMHAVSTALYVYGLFFHRPATDFFRSKDSDTPVTSL
jgi:hypothetical protein